MPAAGTRKTAAILAITACAALHALLFLAAPGARTFPSAAGLGFALGAIGTIGWAFAGAAGGIPSLTLGLIHAVYYAGHSHSFPHASLSDGFLALLLGHAAGFFLHRRTSREETDTALRAQALEEKLNAEAENLRSQRDYSAMLVKRLAKFPELRRSCEALGRCLRRDELAATLVEEAARLTDAARSAALYLKDPEANQLLLAAWKAKRDGIPPPSVSGDAHDRHVFSTRKPFLSGTCNVSGDASGDKDRGDASVIIVPLLQTTRGTSGPETEAVGVLRVASDRREAFSREELELLNIVADLGTMALSNVALYEKTEKMAITDALTGLLTQYEFRSRLAEEISRADRDGREISLLMMDVDHFKPYNDTYGHQAGDVVLRRVGELLREMRRPGDLMARYGGEGFAALLMTDMTGAAEAGEQLRARLESEVFRVGEKETRITISGGIAAFPVHARDGEGLIEAADKALYASKAGGRNRLTRAGG
ncbi:MAG: GGDEF domain-containing protein [Planctomycetota bacterium]|nr:GGDEF domain-containing protein [Planctomycetota bacterium]